jgi:hypothetical protein
MELKSIQRVGRPEEVIIIPSPLEGILTGLVISPRGVGFFEMVGRGILLHKTPPETVELVKNDPAAAKNEVVKAHPDRPNSFILADGLEGTIYETLDGELDPVRGRRLAFNSFNEYAPHPESLAEEA